MKVSNQRLLNATLVAAALIAGWTMLGWQGVVLAITVIGFWMVLQFNRATRQMRNVADRPKGMVDSVVTLQSKLGHGMSMADVLSITNSLGQRVQGTHGDWMWRDSYGNQIVVTFRRGGVERWAATRTDGGSAPQATPEAATATGSARQPSAAAA